VSAKKNEPPNTQKNANEARINDLSKPVIGCALAVSNQLGAGFLEKTYENAHAYEFRKRGLAEAQQGGVVVSVRPESSSIITSLRGIGRASRDGRQRGARPDDQQGRPLCVLHEAP